MADLCQVAKQLKEKFTSFEINHVLRVCTEHWKKFPYVTRVPVAMDQKIEVGFMDSTNI